MKIKIFDKAISLLSEKATLVKKSKIKQEIVCSYCVKLDEAFTETTYCYMQTKDGKEALYIHPEYHLIYGENILTKKELKRIPKKTYKGRANLNENELTADLFNRIFNNYKEQQSKQYHKSKYIQGFKYLQSLYYTPPDYECLEDFLLLYDDVKKECDRLGITYETDPEIILAKKLSTKRGNKKTEYIDVSICKSRESIDKYYEENVLSCKNNSDFAMAIDDLEYLCMKYNFTYPGEFLIQKENLINALEDKKFPNRESILKNYLEFFISKELAFGTTRYLNELTEQAKKQHMDADLDRFNKNPQFLEALETIIKHDQDKETYRYHATTSIECAERIITEGLYMFSKDLSSTSFAEFNTDQILSYSYGNLFEKNGDYIVIISEPTDEDIVRELTEEEKQKAQIIPRRIGMAASKPSHKIDAKYIVGIVDKKSEQIIFNEEYINSRKKQTNI